MISVGSVDPSFWDVGGYKANVKRLRDGADQLDEYAKMVKERIEIEHKYGKSLQAWHTKWGSYADQSAESVSKSVWAGLMDEAKEMAKTHLAVRDRCSDELLRTVQLFRRENYHQSAIRGFKEAKETEEEFEKAQRPWKKLFEKVESSKKAYHNACRAERSASIQLMNLQGDSSTSSESGEKMRDRHEKCQDDVTKLRQNYESALHQLKQYTNVYSENMTFVFEKCQLMESKRLRFLFEMFSGFQQILADLVNSNRLSKVHDDLSKQLLEIGDADIQNDLKRWSSGFGCDVPLVCPSFEEYTPEMRQLSNNGSRNSKKKDDSGGVVLMKQKITSDELPGTPTIAVSLERQSALQKYPENISRRGTLTSQLSTTSYEQKKLRKDMTSSGEGNVRQVEVTECIDSKETNENAYSRPGRMFKSGHDDVFVQHKATDLNTVDSNTRPALDDDKPYQQVRGAAAARHIFHAPLPLPTPNRALMHASCDPTSPIQQNDQKELRGRVDVKKEQPSPKALSDSGNSNGTNESDDIGLSRPARVLYDYTPLEDDEIPLSKGELLDVLQGPDDLGWCYGKKGSVQGLFPAGYVAVLPVD